MELKRFQVEVVSRQRALYLIEASNPETAERVAAQRWQEGRPSDLNGFEWFQLEGVYATELPDDIRQAQDEELLLRFIRERERLLMRLGGNLVSASLNDAISAHQAAADLGWVKGSPDEPNAIDTVRAATALERLCGKKRLVCFEKERARSGERGSIRQYCTPDYLEQLTVALHEQADSAAS